MQYSSLIRRTLLVVSMLFCASWAHGTTYIQGVDVYSGDGAVTWSSVKAAGYDFAFVKATEGVNFVDPRFSANMSGANAAGVYVGPYHVTRIDSFNGVAWGSYDGGAFSPTSSNTTDKNAWQDATNEANDFLAAIRPYYQQTGATHFLPPVADVEQSLIPNFGTSSLNKTFASNWIQVFSDTINGSLGIRPIMYLSETNANTYWTSTIANEHPLFWEAWYKGTGTTSPPLQSNTPLWQPWSFWQWSDGTDSLAQASLVPGISGSPDRDVYSGTSAQLAALTFHLPEPTSTVFLGAMAAMIFGRRNRSAA